MAQPRITVVGLGYLGLIASLALAKAGWSVTCVGDHGPSTDNPSENDTRSTALFPASVTVLKSVGVWQACADHVRPLTGIRIVDDTGQLLRSPEITFSAADVGLDALAMNVPNATLHRALTAVLHGSPAIALAQSGHVSDIRQSSDGIVVETEANQSIETDVIIAADGHNSIARRAAGIDVKTWHYDQTAIALSITHDVPHGNISTEFHRTVGPFTTVPGPTTPDGHISHLVWIETPEEAARIHACDDAHVTALLKDRLQGLLGEIRALGPRRLFPIRGQTATTFAAQNTFLIGEAAHVLPPIGAQGMNLGIRDVSGLITSLSDKTGPKRITNAMSAYNDDRRQDVWMRTTAVDVLNRMLISPSWPLQGLRGAGLHLLNSLPALKRAAIRTGFGQ